MADPLSDAGLTVVPAIGLLIAGLFVAFYGKTFFKAVIFLIGAIAGGALAGVLAYWLFPGSLPCIVGGAGIAAIIGGFMALRIVKWILALAVGGIFAAVAYFVSADALITVVAFLAGLVLALLLMDRLLGVITGITGGAMAGYAITVFVAGDTGLYAGLAVGIVVALAGIYYQNWKHKGDLSRPDKDDD